MYDAVPTTNPSRVSPLVAPGSEPAPEPSTANAFARPKSRSFTVPSGVTFTFAGFRSRWRIPRACAAPSASATWRATSRTPPSSIGPSPRISARVRPPTISIASTGTASRVSKLWIAAMFG